MNEMKPEDIMRALEELLEEVGKVKGAHKQYLTIKHALAILREKDAEIERLREKGKEWRACADKLFEEVEIARAEAIDEFAERLKVTLIAGGIYPVIVKNSIEKISMEMKGETDG